MLGGAVVAETIFSVPGLGRLLVDAILNRDYPLVQGVIIVIVFTVVAINFIVDLMYIFINPRLQYND